MTTAPEKPMTLQEASQRLNWLDEERRRDHAELARLAQELAGALALIKDQATKVRQTDERIDAVETSLTHVPRLEAVITAARSELPPLHDADVRLEDEIARQSKDSRSQADQTSRLLSALSGRLDTLVKTTDGLAQHIHALDAQRKDGADRLGQTAVRVDAVGATAAGLAERLNQHEAQRKSLTDRLVETVTRLDTLGKTAESMAGRLQLLETCEKDRVNRDAAIQAQLSRLEVTQGQAVEDVRRSVARAELLITEMQQMRREIMLAQEDEAKRRRDDVATLGEVKDALAVAQRQVGDVISEQEQNAKWRKEHAAILTEQKEAVATALRQIEEIMEARRVTGVQLDHLEELGLLTTETAARLGAAQEQVAVLQATYKGLQEAEDKHWNTDIPEVLRLAEESSATSASNAVVVQEIVASNQALKEAVRELQVNLVGEHAYSEELAAALRGLIEEDLQSRMANTQKQLQSLRRLANAPVEKTETHE